MSFLNVSIRYLTSSLRQPVQTTRRQLYTTPQQLDGFPFPPQLPHLATQPNQTNTEVDHEEIGHDNSYKSIDIKSTPHLHLPKCWAGIKKVYITDEKISSKTTCSPTQYYLITKCRIHANTKEKKWVEYGHAFRFISHNRTPLFLFSNTPIKQLHSFSNDIPFISKEIIKIEETTISILTSSEDVANQIININIK